MGKQVSIIEYLNIRHLGRWTLCAEGIIAVVQGGGVSVLGLQVSRTTHEIRFQRVTNSIRHWLGVGSFAVEVDAFGGTKKREPLVVGDGEVGSAGLTRGEGGG